MIHTRLSHRIIQLSDNYSPIRSFIFTPRAFYNVIGILVLLYTSMNFGFQLAKRMIVKIGSRCDCFCKVIAVS